MNKREVNIAILYDSALNVNQIEEICAGLEEEGVSFLLQKCDKASNYIELGSKAACMSPLKVGIGIDQRWEYMCTSREFEAGRTLFTETSFKTVVAN